MQERVINSYAKKLVSLSADDKTGKISHERVSAILESLNKKKPKHHKKLLKKFFVKIETEIRREFVCIFYAGTLAESTLEGLKAGLKKHYNRELTVTVQEDPSLIAGVRIRAADDVWDASVDGRLKLFKTAK